MGKCEAGHDHIKVGYAGDEGIGSFGAFIEKLPVGMEIISISGRTATWTGQYEMSKGHWAAKLHVTDANWPPGDRTMHIHTCLINVWEPTGKMDVSAELEELARLKGDPDDE